MFNVYCVNSCIKLPGDLILRDAGFDEGATMPQAQPVQCVLTFDAIYLSNLPLNPLRKLSDSTQKAVSFACIVAFEQNVQVIKLAAN